MATKKKAIHKKRAVRAPRAPRPKHVTISTEQRLHVHVTKGGKQVREYIAGANATGDVTMNIAPEAAEPVVTPSPVSGT